MRTIRLGRFPEDFGEKGKNKTRLSAYRLKQTRIEFLKLARKSRKTKEPVIFEFGIIRGGNGPEALRLAEAILGSDVETIGQAHSAVDSAGLIIFLACRRRLALSKASFKFHPMYLSRVKITWIIDPIKHARLERKCKNLLLRVIRIFQEQTFWMDDQIPVLLQKGDWKRNSKKALQANIITKIVDSFE